MSTKEELEESNQAYKEALERQLNDLRQDARRVGKTALWVGGGLFATYLVVDALTGKPKKKKNKEKTQKSESRPVLPGTDNLLISTVKQQALVFLLGLAAQKLTSFLGELNTKDEEDNT